MAQAPDAPATPDRFTIIRRIGAGGMGVVYEAFDRDRRRAVALKTLREFDPAALYRFKHEFRALAAIVHPNLIPLYELVADGERWFFTMELVGNGVDLLGYLRGRAPEDAATVGITSAAGSMEAGDPTVGVERTLVHGAPADVPRDRALAAPPADYARLRAAFRDVAVGVAALHRAGKLHRDLKPSNVMVGPNGRVLILDFGLIAELGSAVKPGQADVLRADSSSDVRTAYSSTDRGLTGTLAYMSPEQAARDPLTTASDWYSVGVMLFQALTGRLPFDSPGLQLLQEKLTLDAPAPSSLVPGTPADLDRLCVALLDRNPLRRPGAAAVVAALGGAVPQELSDDAGIEPAMPFVGRTVQLGSLHAAFEDVRGGGTVVCHVSGRSGAGKSALIERFIAEVDARSSPVVLSGRCYEQESVPYKAVDSLVDALTRYLVALSDSELVELKPPHVAELGRMFPVLRRAEALFDAPADQQAALDPRDVRRRAFDALRSVLGGIARARPLVLHIDDLQWGDVDSAALLAELLRPPDAPRVLLLLAYRSEYFDRSPCLQSLAADGLAGAEERRIDVDALTEAETRELAAELLRGHPSAPQHVDWVVSQSGGSAFFVHELVEHVRGGGGPVGTHPDLDSILWQRITRLPEVARRLLEVVAVAGAPVPLEDAQIAAHLPGLDPQVVPGLRAARLVRTSGPGLQDEIETFHDRIRESITANLRPESVRHHHAGLAASLELSGRGDTERLAAHFEGAGDAARASAYYAQAATQAVHVLAFDRAETLLKRAASLATTDAERAVLQERMIHFYSDMARFRDAYAVGRDAVKAYGISLPASFVPPLFLLDFVAVQLRMRGRTTADILDLPRMPDERLRTAVRLMNAVAKAAYQIKPQLCIAVAAKIVKLCLRHGNTEDSAIGYMVLGCIFRGGVLGNHRAGYDAGRLALDLVEKYRNDQQRAEVEFVVGYFGTSWMRPAREAEALWHKAISDGMRTFDLFHTGAASAGLAMSAHMRGVPMDQVWSETAPLLDFLERHRLTEPRDVVSVVRQGILNLRGRTRTRRSLDDDGFDEQALQARFETFGSRHFVQFCLVLQCQLRYLWGDIAGAAAAAARSAAYAKDTPGMLQGAEHQFYAGLVQAAQGRAPGGAVKKFRRWAADCPDNFEHKMHVLAGEAARVAGRDEQALAAYAAAEHAAARFGYVHIEALAAQLSARLLAARGRQDEAAAARARSAAAYRRWGADAYAAYVAGGERATTPADSPA